MNEYHPINWKAIPDEISKEQFYRICHISKTTALQLLKSGVVPCEDNGKKTRCYTIKKEDVRKYLENKANYPELYASPKGWYDSVVNGTLSLNLSASTLTKLKRYYTELLYEYDDVLTVSDIIRMTGYAKTTINKWCNQNKLKSIRRQNANSIPKVFLIEFFCSIYFRAIIRKTEWHIETLNEFQHYMTLDKYS